MSNMLEICYNPEVLPDLDRFMKQDSHEDAFRSQKPFPSFLIYWYLSFSVVAPLEAFSGVWSPKATATAPATPPPKTNQLTYVPVDGIEAHIRNSTLHPFD